MIRIEYPEYPFRIKKDADKEQIFDPLRKAWVRLTPEEWVRQNFIQYLLQVKKYPAALIAIEREIRLGELRKRFDILVYNNQHQPWLMIECKGMDVALTEDTLQQVLRYNIAVPVQFLVITNGSYCAGYEKTGISLSVLSELPVINV
jgi:hypothetical protein